MASDEMMCSNCRTMLAAGTKFCTGCGRPVASAPPPEKAAAVVGRPDDWARLADAPAAPPADVRPGVGDWFPPQQKSPAAPPPASPRQQPPPPPAPPRQSQASQPTTVAPSVRRTPRREVPPSDPRVTRVIPRVEQVRLYGWIVVMNGADTGKDHRITSWPVTIGRDQKCDVVLADDSVSRVHGRLRRERRTTYFDDGGSANGSMRNGRLVESSELRDGDVLKLGETWLLYKEAVPKERET